MDKTSINAGASELLDQRPPHGPAPACLPRPDEAHIYQFPLDLTPGQLNEARAWLSNEEKARAERFRFERHRNRFIAGRAALRWTLGAYLGESPESLRFDYGRNGKPELPSSPRKKSLQFNLAHSDDLALLGISSVAAIGVDLERVRFLDDFDELVARFFSPAEALIFRNLDASEKPRAFFNLWTRKEAWLKATGEGIAHLLSRVEVSFLPDEDAKIRRLPPGPAGMQAWCLHDIPLAEDFAAAVVTQSSHYRIQLFDLPQHVFSFSELRQSTKT